MESAGLSAQRPHLLCPLGPLPGWLSAGTTGSFPSDTFSDLCLCFKYRPCRTNTLRAKNLKVMGKKINIPYLDAHPIEMERESDEFESFPPS